MRYREMGGRVWLEPNIKFNHIGVKAWEGNYHEYLLNKKLENRTTKQKVKDWIRGVNQPLRKRDPSFGLMKTK